MSDENTTETTSVDNTEDAPADDEVSTAVETSKDSDEGHDDAQGNDEPDTFPRSYVEELRQESGRYRQRAQRADDLAQRLHAELVRATGKLADPTDMPFDENHLDDPEALTAAVDDLLTRKPHLASRRPAGDIGQGATPSAAPVDLAAMLRQRA
jgi:hypothetical protein